MRMINCVPLIDEWSVESLFMDLPLLLFTSKGSALILEYTQTLGNDTT